MSPVIPVRLREVAPDDLEALLALEEASFATDRLSRRSFRHWITAPERAFIVAEVESRLVGYVLVIYHRGTRLARIYSLAIDAPWRGRGIARQLIEAGEQAARDSGRLFIRLEVSINNEPAIRLYESLGYRRFGTYRDYYDDHTDALRYQKRIRHYQADSQHAALHWMQQSTPFTCGPVSLMMAMRAISPDYTPSLHEELQIWREATTIFMTSGHGGCHPLGLALAARQRGFATEVWINQEGPLFVDSVRSEEKKHIIEMVHADFLEQSRQQHIPLHYQDISQDRLVAAIDAGSIPIVLISTYRMDGRKAPHWVVVSGYDEDCLYVHDPDPEEGSQSSLDCQFLPIARGDFDRMSYFGQSRLRTGLVVSAQPAR